MFLYINTVQAGGLVLALINNQGQILKLKKINAKYKQSERLLVNIEKITGGKLKKIKGIIVIKGPGSFTALRIGLTTANVLAWSLSIPIIGLKSDDTLSDKELIARGCRQIIKKKEFKIILPLYGQEPNITLKK